MFSPAQRPAGHVLLAAVALAVAFLVPEAGRAGNRVWDGSSSTAWNTAANWSGSAVPGASDTAIFNATSVNCTTGAAYTVGGLIVEGGYTGTLTASGGTLTTTSMAITDGLIGYWRLDETSGTTAKDVAMGADMTYLGAGTNPPLSISGHAPTTFANPAALDFDSDDALTLTTYPDHLKPPGGNWTVSAWITKSTTFGPGSCGDGTSNGGAEIYNAGDDVALRVCGGKTIRVFRRYSGGWGDCVSTALITTSTGATWNHVAATSSGTTLKVYVNGTEATCTSQGAQTYSGGTFRIGKHISNDSYDYDGHIDEVRFYDRALTVDEIDTLYAGRHHSPQVNTAQALAGTFSVAEDLFISGQRIAFGSSTVTVGGSFFNVAASSTGSTAISLTGSGTGEVGGYGGFVHALTLGGSATRTLTDQLVVIGALNISSATIISNRTVYAGTINHTAGALTTTGSTVVVDHGAAQTLKVTTSSLNTLHLGNSSTTGLIGYWKLDETSGTNVPDSSGTGKTGTVGGLATWSSAVSSDITFTNPRAFEFDGDTSKVTFSNPTYYAPITIATWIYMTGSGEGTFPRIMQLPLMDLTVRTAESDRISVDITTDTIHPIWKTEKGIVRDTWQHLAVSWSGSLATPPIFYINGLAQTTLVHTTGTGSRTTTFTAPGTSYMGNNLAGDRAFDGRLDDVRLYNVALTETEVRLLAAGKGETAAFTLGAALTASGAVTIEKGSLATSTYALTSGTLNTAGTILTVMDDGTLTTGSAASSLNGGLSVNTGAIATTGAGTVTLGHDATETLNIDGTFTLGGSLNIGAKAAHVDSGGSFIMGPGTVTATQNLTVNAGGTLRLDSVNAGAAPTISLATGTTLLVNGTLKTTIGTTALQSIIKATSGTFIFNVSTVAAGTTILDIEGLAVQNTASQGMYINSNATAATTFTSFKNIDFSHSVSAGGPFAYLLQIDADSLSATFDDLTFDTTNTTYNFRLKDRNGGTNTRAFVGATCIFDLDCEANDHDGDVGAVAPINDNNIDTVAANPDEDAANSALIFWGERAHSDTAGTIVGFPVAAYDWNDFSFRANYVSFNNASGTGDILYVRDEDGSPQYQWPLPPNAGNTNGFVGAPRWTEVITGNLHYVHVVDSDGNVYKLLDSGSSLALAASPWNTAYRYTTDGTATTASSPLTIHGAFMYWYGFSGLGASSPRMFRLGMDKSPTGPHTLGAGDLLYTAPSIASVASVDFVFGATTKNGASATVYKIATTFSPVTSTTVPTANVNGRVTVLGGIVYFLDETGKLWARTAADLSVSSWFFRDGTANHAPVCANTGGAAGCLAKNFLIDPVNGYAYYGDADGHVYCANSTAGGSACTNYTNFRPGTSADVFETAPLLREGVLVIGAVNGNVYFIDRSAGTVFRRYEFGAPVSSISYTYDRNDSASGAFTIATGTPPGKLYQIRRTHVLDPSGPL